MRIGDTAVEVLPGSAESEGHGVGLCDNVDELLENPHRELVYGEQQVCTGAHKVPTKLLKGG